jgi:hypothetical protein
MLVVYQYIWTACQSNLQGFGSYLWSACPLKMGPIGCPRALVVNYQHILQNNAEEQRPQVLGNF